MKVNLSNYGMPRCHGAESDDAFAVKTREETVIAVLADGAGVARDARGGPLLEKNPLLFYRLGFWVLPATTLFLPFRLFIH